METEGFQLKSEKGALILHQGFSTYGIFTDRDGCKIPLQIKGLYKKFKEQQ